MDCFHLFTAWEEGKAAVTLESTMVDIVSMHRKIVVQEEFFLAVVIEVAEDHLGGVRIDKGGSDCVRFLNVVCHVTDRVCLKIAIVPITSRWSVLGLGLRLQLLTSFSSHDTFEILKP